MRAIPLFFLLSIAASSGCSDRTGVAGGGQVYDGTAEVADEPDNGALDDVADALDDLIDAAADLAAEDQPDPPDAAPPDGAMADAALPDTWGLQPEPLPLPTFTQVVDSEAQPVTQDALIGHYTVVWFYPAASTGG